MGSFSPLQGIFPTQGSNPGLQHCSPILYQLSYQGSLIALVSLINMCLSVFFLGFILYGIPWTFLDLDDYFLSHIREVFDYNFFKYFLRPFLFLFSCEPYYENVGTFNFVPEFSETILISFYPFSFILFHDNDFPHSIFQLTYPFFCLLLCY